MRSPEIWLNHDDSTQVLPEKDDLFRMSKKSLLNGDVNYEVTEEDQKKKESDSESEEEIP